LKTFRQRLARGLKFGLPRAQAAKLARLKTPAIIQDFINTMPANFEPGGDTCLSALEALRQRRAHCIEAAFIAACALWMNGEPPLLLDLQARGDHDHVVALFRRNGLWGAISKSNHVWLRWRDPVYKTLRELTMSYFHEYVAGRDRTLLAYSVAFDLRRFDPSVWITGKESCWEVAGALDDTRHYKVVTGFQARQLRECDPIEMQADRLYDFKRPRKARKNKAKRR
jgi:hypothetical protein